MFLLEVQKKASSVLHFLFLYHVTMSSCHDTSAPPPLRQPCLTESVPVVGARSGSTLPVLIVPGPPQKREPKALGLPHPLPHPTPLEHSLHPPPPPAAAAVSTTPPPPGQPVTAATLLNHLTVPPATPPQTGSSPSSGPTSHQTATRTRALSAPRAWHAAASSCSSSHTPWRW